MSEMTTEFDGCGDRWNDMACTLPPGHEGMHVDERVFGSTTPESNLAMGTIDDERCHRCRGKNIRWSAPSPLWNRVMRGNDINGEPRYGDLVCIRCFIVLAVEGGIDGTWRVSVDPEPDGLIYETPSGRVWDRERGLWTDPPHPREECGNRGPRIGEDGTLCRHSKGHAGSHRTAPSDGFGNVEWSNWEHDTPPATTTTASEDR